MHFSSLVTEERTLLTEETTLFVKQRLEWRIQLQTKGHRIQNLEIFFFKFFQYSARRARILMGFSSSTMLLDGADRTSHGHNSGS